MKQSHAHKLKRHTYSNGTQVYFCTLPDCSFRSAIGLNLGKRTICWRCGKEFLMNVYSLTLAKPHCEECHVFKNEKKQRRIEPNKRDSAVLPVVSVVSTISESIGTNVVSSLKDKMTSALNQVIEYKTLEEKDDDL